MHNLGLTAIVLMALICKIMQRGFKYAPNNFGRCRWFLGRSPNPYGTLAVNISGCFLIGIFAHLVESQGGMTAEMRLLLMVGLLGSFTTYSTFSSETMNLLQDQRLFLGLINIGTHIIIGLSAVLLGRFTIITIWR